MRHKIFLFVAINILTFSQLFSRQEGKLLRIGIDFGIGKQHFFPFSSLDYDYSFNSVKVLIYYPLKKSKKFSYELQIESGIYSAKHILLNEYFVQPEDGANYMELREIYTKGEKITEYVLNIGMVARYNINEKLSFFSLISVGPMISDTQTERLAKGFAFSDIVALGVGYKVGKIMFEIRPGIRHVSNANLKQPNSGHNSSNIDFGISVSL